jgi:hypothetical protein
MRDGVIRLRHETFDEMTRLDREALDGVEAFMDSPWVECVTTPFSVVAWFLAQGHADSCLSHLTFGGGK